MTDVLKLSLLGKIEAVLVQADGTEVPLNFNTNKALALLCYLATTSEAQARAELAPLLWGDDTEEKARGSLRVVLSNLRKLLPDHIDITSEEVNLKDDAGYRIDLDLFEVKTESIADGGSWPDTPALEEAVTLYRDDFMADFFIDGAPAFEDWVLSERARWRQLMLDALIALANWYLQQRRYSDADAALKRLLSFEPWQEEAHRLLMITLSRMGEFNAALGQYDTCVAVLAKEMDVAPEPETTALYERIQTARRGRTHNLPSDTAPFVGRDIELTQINNMIANPDCRLLTIVGLGGMGKTALAMEAARQAAEEQALIFLNGVSFVSLVNVTSPDALPLTIADALNISLTGQARATTALLSHLRNQETLLVLDNYEQLVDSAVLDANRANDGRQILQEIIDACPAVTLLVTSREPLNLAAEWRLDLEGLTFPQEGTTTTASAPPTDAETLFLQSARQVQPDFQLDPAARRAILRIVQAAVGMPLAIKLAASWLRAMPIQRIVTELEKNLDILSSRLRDIPARQRSMRVVFDYSWDLLTAEEQEAFQSLSMFRGGFTEEAAQEVAETAPELLASLVDRWLLQLSMTGMGLRYAMHELVRQYAAEKRHGQSEANATIQARHSAYYVNYIQTRLGPIARNGR